LTGLDSDEQQLLKAIEPYTHSQHKLKYIYEDLLSLLETASVVYWLEFLATDQEVPGSIPAAVRFSEK
jgi:hypothetical protein